ncbi:multicopper oxidase family protein [Kitasatospora cathayae]|uniref:Multicopper oxidase domain-containing protein n=1 Tax=Kitasatospora cathayae TaxID=3004092 RepID=A0ABY7PVV0_9ACTN|nr:multicopper oxidase domain-containing protein [Kitasatospora sp. HUAS 3-15]WBP84553.1 multicopper oxidase domain-containing protein [Kitasatospora sp. HUAS 3-15]
MPVERVLELVAVHRGAVPGVELGGLLVQLRLRELVEVCLLLKTTIWGYDGGFPGSTFVGRRGRPVSVRVRNRLPVPTSTHLHGGITAPESDGYPTDLLLPVGCGNPARPAGGRWTPAASHGDHVAPGDWQLREGEKTYEYPLDQQAATLWYHDHRMDFSGPQVWRGLAGFFLVHDEQEQALPLPSGERDIPLMICDRSFAADGALVYPALDDSCTGIPGVQGAYAAGVLGDVQLVNGAPWPVLEVAAVRYRFRLLNAANARRYRLALEADGRPGGPLVQIGSDAGLLERPVAHEAITLAPAERFDVVVDFGRFPPGSTVTLVNTIGEGQMRQVLQFRVTRQAKDDSAVPTRLAAPAQPLGRDQAVAVRHFDFRRTEAGDDQAMWTINGRPFTTTDTWATPRLDTVELWRLSSDFHHPVHLHLAQFQVLTRGGKPRAATDAGWKDTVDVRPYEVVEVLVRFRGYRGRYMLHCHNLEHEDMAMMANFDVV